MLTAKQDRFAQAIALEGMTQVDAYRAAYNASKMADETAYVKASEMANRDNIKVRINTNGQSDLILGKDTAPEYKGAFDIVSISLNSPTAKGYQSICHSVFGEKSFDALLTFASNVKKFVPIVHLSAVKETLNSDEIELCKKISSDLGVTLRLRDYIPPET